MGSLAVKYRPKTFEEICGQESVKKILTRMVESGNIKNALIFSGSSGSGKTTSARAFANLVNNGAGHPIEIDAASNNGVDNIRAITDDAELRSLDSKYKVYILDEAHQLTIQSWNALLKTIEEPPKYTIFILCTTEYEKIPDTIKNRCMIFRFGRISPSVIAERLKYIAEQEGFEDYKDSCDYISKICKGQMRDAISALEKVASYSEKFNLTTTMEVLGNYSFEFFFRLFNAMVDGNFNEMLNCVNEGYDAGLDFKVFVDQFISFLLDLEIYLLCNKDIRLTNMPESMEDKLSYAVNFKDNLSFISSVKENMLTLKKDLKGDTNEKTTVEVALFKCIETEKEVR